MRQGANWRRAAGIGLACPVLCLSLLACSAQAAVLGWSQNDEADDVITYEYRGDRGERNQVKVSANTRSGTVLIRDEGAHRLTVTAPGCQRGQGRTVRCQYREFRDLSIETSDRDDRVDIAASASYLFGIAAADGGRGDDRVSVRSTTHQLLIELEGGRATTGSLPAVGCTAAWSAVLGTIASPSAPRTGSNCSASRATIASMRAQAPSMT